MHSKLTKKTLDDVIKVVLVSLLLTLNIFHTFFFPRVSIVRFEQVNVFSAISGMHSFSVAEFRSSILLSCIRA